MCSRMIKKNKVLLLTLMGIVLICGGLYAFIFLIDKPGNSTVFPINGMITDRPEYDTAFLTDGTMLRLYDGAFIVNNCSGITGNIDDGSQYIIRHGIFEKLFLLSKGKTYRIYVKDDVVKAIESNIRQGIIKHAENGLFYDRWERLFCGEIITNYKALTSTAYPEKTKIIFKHGKIWKIEEYDKNMIGHYSFNMDEIIFFHDMARRFTKTYIDPNKEYFGAGVPCFISDEKIPYIEEPKK